MSEKLRVVRAKFENVFGFTEFEFELGKFTLITGPNEIGKTAALEAVRSMWTGTAHDATLLKRGAKKGEIVLVLSDGVELAKELFEGKTLLSVKVPKLGKISRAPGYLKALIGSLAMNPLEFMSATPVRKKEMFLSALPLQITREQLTAAVGFPLTIPVEGHALDVIAAAEKMFYTDRTEKNRALKQKQAAAQQIEESLPKAPPSGDWEGAVESAERSVNMLEHELQERMHTIQATCREAMLADQHLTTEQIAFLRETIEKRIQDLRSALAADIASKESHAGERRERRRQEEQIAITSLQAEVSPQLEEARAAREHARTMAMQHVQAESARKLLAQFRAEEHDLAEESESLTQGLEGLRMLRANLTAELPIPGVEIHEHGIYLENMPVERAPESRQMMLAVELAMLGAGELGLIVVDGLEALDREHENMLRAAVAKYEHAQLLGAKVREPDPDRPETLGLLVEREE